MDKRNRMKYMEEIIQEIKDNWDKLLKDYYGKKKENVATTLHRLKENLWRLELRYKEYKVIEEEIQSLSEGEDLGERLHYLQLKLVDKVEAFHQQVYSTLSVIILVLNYIGINGTKSNHPINSVNSFLEYLKKNVFRYKSVMIDQIQVLEKSVDFRAKFVDHPQQHQLHDWMTFGFKDQVYIIYFIRHGNEIFIPAGSIDPLSPDFKPPVNCKDDFYVAPDKKRVMKSVGSLVKVLLELR